MTSLRTQNWNHWHGGSRIFCALRCRQSSVVYVRVSRTLPRRTHPTEIEFGIRRVCLGDFEDKRNRKDSV